MKRGIKVLAAVCIALSLTACASMPDLTTEEEEMVTEYATSLLLKYDSENHTRLVDVDSYVNAYETAKALYDEQEAAYYEAKEEEENERKAENAKQEELNSVESSEEKTESGSSHNDGTGGATVTDSRSIDSVLGLNDVTITYTGYSTGNEYPEENGDIYLGIVATTGKEILTLYFDVTNNSSEAQNIDIFDINPSFKLSVNGGSYASVYETLLEDDLSLYTGTFNAGETKQLVLITEVSEGTVVTSLGMKVSLGSDSITKSLMQSE